MPFERSGRTDLEFRAVTGEAKRDLGELRRVYQQSTGAMSEDALRLAVAQEKLDRALARTGPTSTSTKSATLALRREQERLAVTTTRTTGTLEREQVAVGRLGRGALAGSGLMRGLGRSVAFASTAFLGGAGLVYAIKSTVEAAIRSQAVLAQTENAVKNAGQSWAQYGERIKQAALETSKLSGFDDERLLQTFSLLVRRTKDVNRALELNALAADVARGRNISLEQAATLVVKASIGQAGALRRLGINAKQGASALELLDLLSRKYAGSAEAYGRTAAGAQDRFRVAIENLQEAIGAGLLPEITRLLNKGADWLNDSRNQERITRDVGRALHDAGQIARGFAQGINLIRQATGPVISALGGLERAAEVALAVGLVLKVRKAALSFGLIRAASTVTKAQVVADAEAEGTALSTVGARGAAGLGKANTKATILKGNLAGLLKFSGTVIGIDLLFRSKGDKGAVGFIERTLGGVFLGGSVAGVPGAVVGGAVAGGAPIVGGIIDDFAGKGGTRSGSGSLLPVWGGEGVGWIDPSTGRPAPNQIYWWKAFYASGNRGRPIKGQTPRQKRAGQGPGRITGADVPPQTGPAGGGGGRPQTPLTPRQRIEERISRARLAQARGQRGAERELLAALRAQVELDRKNERVYEDLIRRGVGNRAKEVATLQRLRSDEASALGEIASIEEGHARDAKTAADKRKAAAERAHAQALREASTLPKRFQIAENQAKTLEALGQVYRRELAFEKAFVARLRARHAAPDIIQAALLEESRIQAKIRKNREAIAARERRERDAAYKRLLEELAQPSLALRIRQAKIDARKAEGKETRGEEVKLLQAELAEANREYQAALKVARTRKQKDELTLAYWEERARIEQQIAELRNQSKEREGALAREVISGYLDIVSQFGPNIGGGTGAGAPTVVVNQSFPHPPSADGHREATYARHAFGAAFD